MSDKAMLDNLKSQMTEDANQKVDQSLVQKKPYVANENWIWDARPQNETEICSIFKEQKSSKRISKNEEC